ncbi:Twinkle protein, mitochondrial [Gracilariopsis chorda]|uniref:Twinkle protein, mitochondrial n=1 Tax=Gracilariopsis chorda TaxID=448386 RepID=A0A2V3IFZ3_9FLOR|nr:Twinkle protein, mitochondrial [Gracilariopsis chorda]|eukprot:PXF40963.1 Twinkle protein, mitochondrial [Gracilariopsis chorda]
MTMGKKRHVFEQPAGLTTRTECYEANGAQPSPDQQRKYEGLLQGHRDGVSNEAPVKRYLNNERGLTDDVLKAYGVGATSSMFFGGSGWSPEWSMTFPMFDDEDRIARYKIRSIQSKANMKLEPKGGSWGLFGLHTVAKDAEEVVLTEGELDAMSVFQATGRAAISVPSGASSLPIEVLPLLERFKRIYLWMDEDEAGQNGAKQFARKLGLGRCVVVRGANGTDRDAKDANDCLRHGVNMESMISNAKPIQHEGVMRFEDLREEVFAELNGNGSNQGAVKCVSLPRLNNLLKGHRYGEVTILSGHTGVGKTTLLAQMSLDYCLQGVGTLWGSFEVGNVRLAQRLLQQFHAIHRDGSSLLSRFDYWADRFAELPMYFMKYHGSNPVHRIVDVMEYANYAMDCRHMVLDNLQFMTYVSAHSRSEEGGRFEVMDDAVAQIRQFATGCGAHVTLVVHPRKTDDDSRISIASVYGSAKATQEADNVLVLQRTANGKELEVMKNRFDGAVGSIALRFDKKRLLYAEADCGGDWALPTLNVGTKAAAVERVEGTVRGRGKQLDKGERDGLGAGREDVCGLFD